jgi:tetratricopeptide (TPR) repeat protein
MKRIITLCFVITTCLISAQGNYEKGMQKAFELWEMDKTDEALNLFERIAKAEKDNWLPHYYIAQINSLKSWGVTDEAVIKAQLDKAQEHLDIAMALSENNPELMVIQAQVLTNWIAYDGSTYGMKYSAKITELYNKAMAIAPENPRVAFGKVEWEMGSARYFGQDTTPFCKKMEATLELFENFKAESQFHPNWGKGRAKQVIADCK